MHLLTDPYSLHTPQLNKELRQSYLASDDKIVTSKFIQGYCVSTQIFRVSLRELIISEPLLFLYLVFFLSHSYPSHRHHIMCFQVISPF